MSHSLIAFYSSICPCDSPAIAVILASEWAACVIPALGLLSLIAGSWCTSSEWVWTLLMAQSQRIDVFCCTVVGSMEGISMNGIAVSIIPMDAMAQWLLSSAS